MLKGKTLLDCTNLFSPNDYEKNDKVILKYFHRLKRWKNYFVLFAISIINLKYHTIPLRKIIISFYYFSKCKYEDEKLFKEKESVEVLNILGLIENI